MPRLKNISMISFLLLITQIISSAFQDSLAREPLSIVTTRNSNVSKIKTAEQLAPDSSVMNNLNLVIPSNAKKDKPLAELAFSRHSKAIKRSHDTMPLFEKEELENQNFLKRFQLDKNADDNFGLQ